MHTGFVRRFRLLPVRLECAVLALSMLWVSACELERSPLDVSSAMSSVAGSSGNGGSDLPVAPPGVPTTPSTPDTGGSTPSTTPADAGCGDACAPVLMDGEVCSADGECVSGHCGGGLCCAADLCCRTAADCSAEAVSAICEDTSGCQGARGTVACEDNRCVVREGQPDDSACGEDVEADDCGPYPAATCTGEAEQSAPACATRCFGDTGCDADAHCRLFRCVADVEDGEACSGDAQCLSGHCRNGFCCESGDCCADAGDCLGYGGPSLCTSASTCQGVRDQAVCEDFQCATRAAIADDSGCGPLVLANACGRFADLRCSGAADQSAPVCPAACDEHADCDASAHCVAPACVADVDVGDVCDDDAECVTGHCDGGYCCASGDCCRLDSECPGYVAGGVADCSSPGTCSGTRTSVVCGGDYRCQQQVELDASACDGTVRSCGNFADRECPSACATSCASPADCDPGFTCSELGCTLPAPAP